MANVTIRDLPVGTDPADVDEFVYNDDGVDRRITKEALEDSLDVSNSTATSSTGSQTVAGALDDRVVRVGSVAGLRGLDVSGFTGSEGARITSTIFKGDFEWNESDLSAEVTADSDSEIYVAPNTDLTGASGAWVRDRHVSDAYLSVQKTTSVPDKGRTQNRAVISFSFDDGYSSATGSVRTLFDSKGLTCGLGIIPGVFSKSGYAKVSDLLDMQRDGYEILGHGYGAVTINSVSDDPSLVESEINGGLFELQKFGFDVQGFVASQSNLSSAHLPVLKQNFLYGFTDGTRNVSTSDAFQAENLDPYTMHRTSLFGLGVAGSKALIDLAIAEGGYVQFYDHDPDQIGFPNSLSLADLTEVLEYAIDQGALIVNPRDALDLVHSSPVRSRGIEQTSLRAVRWNSENYLEDSSFRTVKRSLAQNGRASWEVDQTGLTGIYTANNEGDERPYTALNVTLSAGQTADTGRVLVQNRKTLLSGDEIRPGALTFQTRIRGENSASGDDIKVTIGINYRKVSDSSVVASKESDELYLDGFPRIYSITDDAMDYSEPLFVTTFVRIVPKTSIGGTVQIAQPMLHDCDKYAIYKSNRIFSTDASVSAFNSTVMANETFVAIDVDSYDHSVASFSGKRITFNTSGLFSIDATLKAEDPAFNLGDRGIIEYRVNGGSSVLRQESYAFAGVLNYRHSFSQEFQKGDYIEFYAFQGSGVSVTPTISDLYSKINVTLVG